MSAASSNPYYGSSFDDFMKDQGIYEEAREAAILQVLIWKIQERRKEQSITKVEMARRMKTSRSQLDRLLDPHNQNVELATLVRAADAVGCALKLDLISVQDTAA
jgi:hypothetical protein